MAILDGVETTCLIDNGARVNLVTPEFVRDQRPGCGFDPGLEPAQWAHSTKQIGGKAYRALRLHDASSPDTVCAELQ